MRISDWSSDVCSSDLLPGQFLPAPYRAGQATLSTLPQRKRLRYFLSRELLQVECANRWECLPAGRSVREGAAHRGFARRLDLATQTLNPRARGGRCPLLRLRQPRPIASPTSRYSLSAQGYRWNFLRARSEEPTSELTSLMRISYA